MKFFKPIAFTSAAALAIAATVSAVASAGTMTVAADAASCNNQPNMASALASLRAGRASLDHAEHNKGGWRDNAIKASDNAIKETEHGCAFADHH